MCGDVFGVVGLKVGPACGVGTDRLGHTFDRNGRYLRSGIRSENSKWAGVMFQQVLYSTAAAAGQDLEGERDFGVWCELTNCLNDKGVHLLRGRRGIEKKEEIS